MTSASATQWLADLGRELDEIDAALDGPVDAPAREALKGRIVDLFKRTDAALKDLAAAKERIRALVDRYNQGAATEAHEPAPGDSADRAHHDHLGASTFIDKGWSLIALGDHAGAEQALRRALELAPGDIQAKSLLGWAQMLGDDHDQALATFSQVLTAEPANALARVNVGFICLRKRIFGEAIEHLSRVIRLDNDRKASLYAHYYLGLVYLERDMFLDAQTFLGKAIQLGPNLIEAYYDLGRAQWLSGDEDVAKATWTKGATANRFAPGAQRCRDVLAAVERGESVPRSSSPA